MRLRKPCEHVDELHPDGHYDVHRILFGGGSGRCPGGEFLVDALVIEKVDGEWPEDPAFIVGRTEVDHRAWKYYDAKVRDGRKRLDTVFDALAVQESFDAVPSTG